MATQIARVDGKLHIFFASFKGLVPKENAIQTPEEGIRVSLVTTQDHRAWFLPFLGEVEGKRQDSNLVFVLPAVEKGAVVGSEAR